MTAFQRVVYEIIPTILFGILAWKMLLFVNKYKEWTKTCNKVTQLGKRHVIFGHMHLVPNLTVFMERVCGVVERTKCKIYGAWVFFLWPVYGVCHPDTIKVLVKSSAPKSKGIGGSYSSLIPWLGDGLQLSEGAKWNRNRRLLTPAFHFNNLMPYIVIYNQAAGYFLNNLSEERSKCRSVEISELLSLATLDVMLRCAFSYDGNVQQDKKHPYAMAVKELTHIVSLRTMKPVWMFDAIFYSTKTGRQQQKLTKYVHQFADDIITARKKSLRMNKDTKGTKLMDFIDILLTAKDEHCVGLTDQEIRDEANNFLLAGHDTTSSTISWAMYALGKYQREQEMVYKEVIDTVGTKDHITWEDLPKLRYLGCFIKEVMRMYNPVPLLSRNLNEPLVFDGVRLPVGSAIVINVVALHHHPEIYPDNNSFRPERFNEENSKNRDPYAFIPFSAGPRNCIGQHFAMHELKVFIARIIHRFKISIDPDHQVEFKTETVMRAKHGIKVFLEDR